MQTAFAFAIYGIGFLSILLTALSWIRTDQKWIRIWDFPRLQIAIAAFLSLFAGLLWLPVWDGVAFAWLAALAASFAWQTVRIWPYTRLHDVQAQSAHDCPENALITLLVSNVHQANRRSKPLLDLVARENPDLLLLLETDSWWTKELSQLDRAYPNAIKHNQSNTYGMHLFSRFDLIAPQVRNLVDDDVPSLKTGVRLKSGAVLTLYGVHPRPPPLADTAQRDAELILVGREARDDAAAIVAGDLNDVAWSRTTHLFQEISGLLDPRIGRGLYPTFNADWRFLRWPLDHVFFSRTFRLHSLAVMPSIGSDHFPLRVSLCYCPDRAIDQERPEPDAADRKEAQQIVRNAFENGGSL